MPAAASIPPLCAAMVGVLPAHGIAGRQDLPLPWGWVLAGACFAVVFSFVALGLLWREPRLDGPRAGRPLPEGVGEAMDSPVLRRALAGVGLLATGWTLLALLFGPNDGRNPVPHVIFVLLWVGVVPASVAFGPVWRWINPLRSVHTGLHRLARLDPAAGLFPLPPRFGWWPAAAGLFAFTWLELVYPDSAELATLRVAVGLYAAVQILAGLVYGSRWFDRGDPFEAWSGLFGRLSPLGRRVDGVAVLRSPLAGLDALRPAPGLVAVVVVMLGSTTFDGVSGSTQWVGFVQSSGVSRILLGTLGLLITIGLIWVLYVVGTASAGLLGGRPAREMPGAFVHSVIPVALGYVIAHYYSFLVFEGQRAFVKLSDPLAIGANWLGTSGLVPNARLIDPTIVANVQVVAIVLGHICGVVLAHDRAIRLFPRARAVVGQLPLLALMVVLTTVGLLLLFAA